MDRPSQNAPTLTTRLTPRDRLNQLLDPGSFRELNPGPGDHGDGVVTGTGAVDARPVAAYAQDFAFHGGSLGVTHARKIAALQDEALSRKIPLLALCDSGGARIQDGVASLAGYGDVFARNVKASGVIPQLSAILGPCAGGAVYSPALTDFVFMVRGLSKMFITGPEVVKAVQSRDISLEELGGAALHAGKSGNCHFLASTEEECFTQMRTVLGYLPSSCAERSLIVGDGLQAGPPSALASFTSFPADPRHPYDVRDIVGGIIDGGSLLEVHAGWAQNCVVAFARLGGQAAGIVANQPRVLAGALDVHAAEKIAGFVRMCDAFNLPVLTFVDVPGYLPGQEQETAGVIRHGAKIVSAYGSARVPRLTVILRKAYGGAYVALGSLHLGASAVYAWPAAEIAVMGVPAAVSVLHKRDLAEAPDPEARARLLEEQVRDYAAEHADPRRAAARGFITAVIEPQETRSKLLADLAKLRP